MKKTKYLSTLIYVLLFVLHPYNIFTISEENDVSLILDLESDDNGNDDNIFMPDQIGQMPESHSAFDSFNQEGVLVGLNGALDDFDSSIPGVTKNLRLNNSLIKAVIAHDENRVKKILKRIDYIDYNVNYKNRDGLTALHYAALGDDNQLVTLLLNSGAQVNIIDSLGRTPLHLASQSDALISAQILIDHGANLQLKSNYDKIPADYAMSEQMQDLLLV